MADAPRTARAHAGPRRALTLSPINQERWRRFKAHRRGFISLWIFLALFGLSLFADLIANDVPLFVMWNGRPYFPVLRSFTEKTFGGEFETDADYRDPLATKSLRPFRIVHRWTEAAKSKTHTETIERLPARYAIHASGEPEMVSVTYEMEATR